MRKKVEWNNDNTFQINFVFHENFFVHILWNNEFLLKQNHF